MNKDIPKYKNYDIKSPNISQIKSINDSFNGNFDDSKLNDISRISNEYEQGDIS